LDTRSRITGTLGAAFFGHGHYEDLKMERARHGNTMHSDRWTLVMNIVTYANKGGTPLNAASPDAESSSSRQ